ncbi:MAG: hypothetical protein ACK4UT_00730 [Moraxellaceae bacterium]
MKKLNALAQGMGALALVSALASTQALADTAGGATIHNVARLTYAGAGSDIVAAVDVGVQTVAALPTVQKNTADITVISYGTANYTFVITSNSNGSDSFALALSSVDVDTAGTPSLSFRQGGTPVSSIVLGASVTSAPSGAGEIYIPAGSQANLNIGDTVRIGSDLYTISGVTAGTAASTDLISGITTPETPTTLALSPVGGSPAITAGLIPAGVQVGEQVTLVQRVVASAPSSPTLTATHTVSFTATSTATDLANNPVVYNSAGVTDTITYVITNTTTLNKFVRNDSRPTGNSAGTGAVTCNGNTFYSGGVTTKTGDTLAYCLRASVATGEPNLTSALITDDIPPYTSYVPNSTSLNGTPVADVGGTTPLATANGGLIVNSPGEPAGEIAGGDTAVVVLQVVVD